MCIMESNRLVFLVLVTMAMSPAVVVRGEFTKDGILQNIDDFITAGMSCHNNPGLTVSVVKDGKVLLAKGYGYKTLEKTEENLVTNETLFGIASLSKAFASAALLRVLEDYDNITLTTTVADVLDGAKVFNGYLRQRYATLEDLLAHRLGIPSNNKLRYDDTLTRSNLVARLQYLKPVGSFRGSFYYSNLVYGLVTYITEKLGKKSWEDIVASELFQPLGMTSSTFMTTAEEDQIDLAKGYQDIDGGLYPVPFEFSRHWALLCGSGCVISNAVDMTRWMMFHLAGGINTDNKRVLGKKSVEACHKEENPLSPSTARKYYTRPLTPVTLSHDTYGLGWKNGHYRGFPIWTHSGSTYGYRAYLTLIPGINAGIFVALTGTDPSFLFRTNIHNYIADLLMGETPWLNTTTVCSFPEPWQPKSKSSGSSVVRTDITAQRSLPVYTGVYTNPSYGRMTVYVNETTNALNLHYGILNLELYPKTKKDQFAAVPTGMLRYISNFTTITFDVDDKTGAASDVVFPSFDSKVPPVFERVSTSPTTSSHVSKNTTSHVIKNTSSHVSKNTSGTSSVSAGWFSAMIGFVLLYTVKFAF